MQYTNIFGYKKILYQKYKVTSARVDCTTPNCKRNQVQGLNESRLTIRGDGGQDPVASDEVWTKPVIYSPHCLFGQSSMFQELTVCTRLRKDLAQDL